MKITDNVIELPVTNVPANGSCNIYRNDLAIVSPFDFLTLEISTECHPHLLVTDVKVGKNSQLYSAGCLPASLFAKDEKRPYMFAFDRVRARETICVSLTNVTPQDQVAKIYAVGYYVKTVGPGAGVELYGGPRLGICGLGHTIIPPRATVDVESWSQVRYAPSVLHIPPHLIDQIEVTRVSKRFAYVLGPSRQPTPNPNLTRHDEVPREMLTNDNLAQRGTIKFKLEPVVTLAEKVIVTARNRTDQPVAFTGAMVGESIGRMNFL